MDYKIVYLQTAKRDLTHIYQYISQKLENPVSARRILLQIMNKCKSLALFPEISPTKYELQGVKFRSAQAGKYVIIFSVNKKDKIIYIYDIFYGRQNITNELRQNLA